MASLHSKDSLPGKTLKNGYVVSELIGTGAVCDVYSAFQPVLKNRKVALRVLRKSICKSADAQAVVHKRHFILEAELMPRLKSGCFARILDAGAYRDDDTERPFMAVEFVEGQTVSDLMAGNEVLSPGDGLMSALYVAEGLLELHKSGLVYRDLNPANVKIEPGGAFGFNARLFDFTHVLPPTADYAGTAERLLVGVPPFAPPEQAQGQCDFRGDSWSLGQLVLCLIEGEPHLAGSWPNWADFVDQAMKAEGRDLLKRSGSNNTSKRLNEVLQKALTADPQRRCDLQELVEGLADCARELKTVDRQPGFLARMGRFWSRS